MAEDVLKFIAEQLEVEEDIDFDAPDWPDEVRDAFNSFFSLSCKRLEEMHKLVNEYKAKVQAAEAERDRWAKRVKDVNERFDYAQQVVNGRLPVPTLNQIRESQGLEPL